MDIFVHNVLQQNAAIVFMVYARNQMFARKLFILILWLALCDKILFKAVTMDGKGKHAMNVFHYLDVSMGIVKDHPILVNVTKAGKVIYVKYPFVRKDATWPTDTVIDQESVTVILDGKVKSVMNVFLTGIVQRPGWVLALIQTNVYAKRGTKTITLAKDKTWKFVLSDRFPRNYHRKKLNLLMTL